eukprot:5848260-Alexandrium_andersonii.AAC.1
MPGPIRSQSRLPVVKLFCRLGPSQNAGPSSESCRDAVGHICDDSLQSCSKLAVVMLMYRKGRRRVQKRDLTAFFDGHEK